MWKGNTPSSDAYSSRKGFFKFENKEDQDAGARRLSEAFKKQIMEENSKK